MRAALPVFNSVIDCRTCGRINAFAFLGTEHAGILFLDFHLHVSLAFPMANLANLKRTALWLAAVDYRARHGALPLGTNDHHYSCQCSMRRELEVQSPSSGNNDNNERLIRAWDRATSNVWSKCRCCSNYII